MISLPNPDLAFEYENNFYLASDPSRLFKPIIHYELYKKTIGVPGAFVELGLFKGVSFLRFLTYREMLETSFGRQFIGFDVFGAFPEATLENDKIKLEKYLKDAGNQSISKNQLLQVIQNKGLNKNVQLFEGDINETVPEFVQKNPGIRFSLIHLDVDLYQPSVTCLNYLYPLLSKGGIIMFDDYGIWEGETKAVDDFFESQDKIIQRFPFSSAPSYITKE